MDDEMTGFPLPPGLGMPLAPAAPASLELLLDLSHEVL